MHRRGDPPRQAGGNHRHLRIGKIHPGLRYHLCRGTAPLCGVAVRPMHDSSWSRWKSRMWNPSRVFPRRSPSNRRPPAKTPAPPSARSRRSTTTCVSCLPGSGVPTATAAARRSLPRPYRRWWTRSWRCRRGRKSISSLRMIRGRKGEYRKELLQLRKEGFVRVNCRWHSPMTLPKSLPSTRRKNTTLTSSLTAWSSRKGFSVVWPIRWRPRFTMRRGSPRCRSSMARPCCSPRPWPASTAASPIRR